jgi:hypothetical protein
MSFKKFSTAQDAPGKDGPAGKPKEAAPADQPTQRPGQKPAVVAPASKS